MPLSNDAPDRYGTATNRRHRPGTPLSSCSPRSSKAIPDPATRSFTVDETSTSPGPARHPSTDVHGDPPHAPVDQLAFPGVQTGPDRKAEPGELVGDRAGTPDRPCWTVERRQEPVTCRVHLSPPEATERSSHDGVVPLEEIAPPAVAKLGGALRRSNEGGEEHGGQHPIRLRPPSDAGEELLDLVKQSVLVTDEHQVVMAGQLHERGARDPLSDVAALLHADVPIAGAVKNERGDTDRGEDVPHIDSVLVRASVRAARGLAPCRRYVPHHDANRRSPARVGARVSSSAGPPHSRSSCAYHASLCSGVGAQG